MIEGLKFMLIGMTVVFLFLTLLLCVMTLSSFIIGKVSHLFTEELPSSKSQDDLAEIAAIFAAIKSKKE